MAADVWLALEPRLIERLTAKLDAAVAVQPARDLAGVKEALQRVPGVQVYPGGYRPANEDGAGLTQLIDQSWIVVVVVRNAADQKSGAAARADASPVCDAVLRALLGWRPGAPYGPLKLAAPPAPPLWSPGGYGYYPFAFTTRFTVTGEPR